MSRHKEVEVKVNALVDEGIAEVVEALSLRAGLVTVDSCQGDGERPAYVFFRVSDWRETGRFLFEELSPTLPERVKESVRMQVDALGSGAALGRISFDLRAAPELAKCVRDLAVSSVTMRAPVTSDAKSLAIALAV